MTNMDENDKGKVLRICIIRAYKAYSPIGLIYKVLPFLPFHDEERIVQVFLVVLERLACFGMQHAASCSEGNGMACGSIPLHGGSETRIDVGLAFCHEAELERTACTHHVEVGM